MERAHNPSNESLVNMHLHYIPPLFKYKQTPGVANAKNMLNYLDLIQLETRVVARVVNHNSLIYASPVQMRIPAKLFSSHKSALPYTHITFRRMM